MAPKKTLFAHIALAVLASCSPKVPRPTNLPEVRYESDEPTPPLPTVSVSAPAASSPPLDVSEVKVLTVEKMRPEQAAQLAVNASTTKLTKSLLQGDDNVVLSPWSVTELLAMAALAAKGETRDELLTFLNVKGVANELHEGLRDLRKGVSRGLSQATLTSTTKPKPFVLDVTNSVWADDNAALEASFGTSTHEYFGAEVSRAPMHKQPDDARRKINAWVGDHTRQKITKLLPEGAITSLTRAVLVNAVYFLGSWRMPFLPTRTRLSQFHTKKGRNAPAMLMNQTLTAPYYEDDHVQIVELAYEGSSLAMDVLLPKAGAKEIDSFDTLLAMAKVDKLAESSVALALPRFNATKAFNLASTLKELGLGLTFSDKADFSAMAADKSLYLSQVYHQALVAVDERGTEAAAATGGTFAVKSFIASKVMNVDHPFVFAIRDTASGAVFFVGRVLDPSQK